jgi:hypothetical protein
MSAVATGKTELRLAKSSREERSTVMTRLIATIISAACFGALACGAEQPQKVPLVEEVEGESNESAPSSSERTEVLPNAAAVPLTSRLPRSDSVSRIPRGLIDNHELHVARALEPDPADMVQGSVAATPAR